MPRYIGSFLAAGFCAPFGVVFAVSGITLFDQIAVMEAAGHVHGLSSRTEFLHAYLGKWGVFAVYELLGISFAIAAIDKVRAGLRLA